MSFNEPRQRSSESIIFKPEENYRVIYLGFKPAKIKGNADA
jgi:hypothetical protein